MKRFVPSSTHTFILQLQRYLAERVKERERMKGRQGECLSSPLDRPQMEVSGVKRPRVNALEADAAGGAKDGETIFKGVLPVCRGFAAELGIFIGLLIVNVNELEFSECTDRQIPPSLSASF